MTINKDIKSENVDSIPVSSWPEILRNLNVTFKGFDRAVSKQLAKKRVKDFKISLNECIERVSQEKPNETIGLDGSLIEPGLICLDLDNSRVGSRLINLYLDPEKTPQCEAILYFFFGFLEFDL